MGFNIPDLFSSFPTGIVPQFQRPVLVERLAVCADPSNWLKMAWPLLPVSFTGAVASQFKANAKRVVGASRGKMPLESNGVGINSRRVHAESVVSAFQHSTYTTPKLSRI